MNQPTMTNEQFALWVALKMQLHTRSYTEMAEEYYEWLESKKPKPSVNVPEGYWDGCGGTNKM